MNEQPKTKSQNGESESNFHAIPSSPLEEYKQNPYGLWTNEHTKFTQTSYQIRNKSELRSRQHLYKIQPLANRSLLVHMKNYYNHQQYVEVISLSNQNIRLTVRGRLRQIEALSPNLALVLFADGTVNYLSQWDLRTDPYQEVVTECLAIQCFQRLSGQLQEYKNPIKVFPNLNNFCYQTYASRKNKLAVVKFSYPLKPGKINDFKVSEFQFFHAKDRFKFVKLNNTSLVGWVPVLTTEKQVMEIVIHDLQNDQFEIFRFPNQLEYSCTKISDIWEIRPGVMFTQLCFFQNQHQQQYFSSFVWQYREGTCRKTQFDIQHKHQIQILGQFRNLERRPCPIYYIDMATQQVEGILKLQNSDMRNKVCVCPQYAPELEYWFDDKGEPYGGNLEVTIRKIKWPKIDVGLLVAFILENIIQFCDDDLIHGAIRLIQPEQESAK